MKVHVHCYTVNSLDTKFPENSYKCTSLEEVNKIVADVSLPTSGIKKVEVWFDHSTERVTKVDTDGVGG